MKWGNEDERRRGSWRSGWETSVVSSECAAALQQSLCCAESSVRARVVPLPPSFSHLVLVLHFDWLLVVSS
jgi:hypothetical protein